MIPANSNVYLETSAINYLADRFNHGDAYAIKMHHSLKATRFYISPVSIWEILLTNDGEKKENLIRYIQNIGHEKLLCFPSEFIINFLNKGCPVFEEKINIHSTLNLSETWIDLCRNANKTFSYDKNFLTEKSKFLRKLFKDATKLIEDVGLLTEENYAQKKDLLWLENIIRDLKGIDVDKTRFRDKKLYKISIIFIFLIMCCEVDFDNSYIKNFWGKIGIDNSFHRLKYLIQHFELLIYRGPIVVMSNTVLIQLESGGKSTRGIFWDALHSVYLMYLDIFFTNDEHFRMLRDKNNFYFFKKIIHFSEIEWKTVKMINLE